MRDKKTHVYRVAGMIASIRGKKPHVYRVIILKQMADRSDSTSRNRWRNEANDSKLQSSDLQKNSRDDAQSDCSEMAGFASPRSFEVILQTHPSKNVTV